MEIIFIRHGHGEHLIDHPNRLNTLHPGLTEYGKMQVCQLRDQLIFRDDDLILVSPTRRTIETAQILDNKHNFMISPLVGPRMFPQIPDLPSLACDQIYAKDELTHSYSHIKIMDLGLDCWGEGINRIDAELFEEYAKQLIDWCQDRWKRLIMISHDGTITNYRILLGEHGLTRKDFLGEAGMYRIDL